MAFRKRYVKKRPLRRPRRVMKKRMRPYKSRARKMGIARINVKSLGLNTSYSKTYLKPNRMGLSMRKKYWLGAKNQWRTAYTDSMVIAGNTDQQQNHFSVSFYTPNEIKNYLSAFSLQPGSTGNTNNTNRIFHNKVIGDIVLTNSSNTNVEIEIYSFSSKRDAIDTPGSLFYKGLADQNNSPTFDLSNWYNFSPLDSVAVGQLYKCYKITRVELNPGQSHKRKFTQHLCRPINNELVDQSVDGGDSSMRGITMFEMYIVRSMTIESASGNLTGVSSAKVNYYVTKKYDFKYLFDIDSTIKYDARPTEPTSGLAIYNQGSGGSAVPTTI